MILSSRLWQTQILSAVVFVAVGVAGPARAQPSTGDGASQNVASPLNAASTQNAPSTQDAAQVSTQPSTQDVAQDDTQQNGSSTVPHPQTPGTNAGADSSTPTTPPNPQPDQEPPGGKRVFGVLPNYRTADISQEGNAITNRQKLAIASKDSFDYPLVLLAAGLAGISQLSNQNPSFGQGVEGYAHRLVTGYADQAMGNLFTEGLFPVLLHEDPRYFRRGTGSVGSRTSYALTRIFVTKTDSGGTRFNYSEWLGNAAGVAISNAYYPDTRDWSDNATKLLEQCATDAVSQVLKEFWPDIKRKWFHKDVH
jgi:hypothetical protein